MNLFFITSELAPINSDSGLARLVAQLGGALCALGHRVVAVGPLRRTDVIDRFSLARRLSPLTLDIPYRSVSVAIYDGKLPSGVEVRLIEHDELFTERPPTTDDDDEPLRHAVLVNAALKLAASEEAQFNGWHILQAFGMPGSLAPFLAPSFDGLTNTKRVFTIDHLEPHGRCDRAWVERLGLSWDDFTPERLEFYGELSLMKAGLISADRLLMSGPAALSDACAASDGRGLDGVVTSRRASVVTLPPGLDYARWNPATDVHLSVHFDASQREGKLSCKAQLQNRLELPVRPSTPLVALAPPLSQLALPLARVLDQVMRADVQLIAPRGLDDPLAGAVEEAKNRWPRRVASLELTDVTWHQMIAGADVIMLDAPSDYDAELLLTSLRYGTLPIVRTLGLARDLVVDLTNTADSGNGFLVHEDTPRELLAVVRRACATLALGSPIQDALCRLMSLNCSWEDRARKLEQIYAELMVDGQGEEAQAGEKTSEPGADVPPQEES